MHGSIILVKVGISADAILMLKIFDNQNHTRNSMVLCPDLMQIYIRNTTKYGQPDSRRWPYSRFRPCCFRYRIIRVLSQESRSPSGLRFFMSKAFLAKTDDLPQETEPITPVRTVDHRETICKEDSKYG